MSREVEEFLKMRKIEKIGSSEIRIAEKNSTNSILSKSSAGKSRVGEPRHPDFEKIYRQFMKRYCGSPDKECEKGKSVYYAWLNAHGLDDTKPYRKPQEAFRWAEPTIRFAKEDEEAKYYKVEALFPVSSMNQNLYLEDELLRAARTLIGKSVNMNHEAPLEGVEIIDAEFEDGAVEALLRVSRKAEFKGKRIIDMIDKGEILHVSVEGSCRNRKVKNVDGEAGFSCEGLVLTGLALLQNHVLPGIPLTRIEPIEKIIENFSAVKREMTNRRESMSTGTDEANAKMAGVSAGVNVKDSILTESSGDVKEREWDVAFINNLPDEAFAVIEPAYLRGETKDKRCRHLPHHEPNVRDPDENSTVDLPHLRNALARCSQIKPVTNSISAQELRERARRHLKRHAEALLKTYQEECEKSPCESAKESLIQRLREIERQISKLLLLERRMRRLEALYEKLATKDAVTEHPEETKETVENLESPGDKQDEKETILTKEGFWKRFRQLRSEGLSKSDAYRLTVIEVLETLEKQKKK